VSTTGAAYAPALSAVFIASRRVISPTCAPSFIV
jgi:hypothetical protein